ncbi:MAG: hypothetical protein J0M20_02660 [Burkholderiales bacterium]|nr:hypothetical protein [Burkholderiales bacterium]
MLQQLAEELVLLAQSPDHVQIIDLRSLPIDDAGIARLRAHLGHGEVRAEVSSAAFTTIEETAFGGIWWQRQQASAEASAVAWQTLVVARAPPLMAAHADDVADAAARLLASLHPAEAARGLPGPTGAIA